MGAEQSLMIVLLSKSMDLDDKKPTRWKNRLWKKMRRVSGYFINIILEPMIKGRMVFFSDECRKVWDEWRGL